MCVCLCRRHHLHSLSPHREHRRFCSSGERQNHQAVEEWLLKFCSFFFIKKCIIILFCFLDHFLCIQFLKKVICLSFFLVVISSPCMSVVPRPHFPLPPTPPRLHIYSYCFKHLLIHLHCDSWKQIFSPKWNKITHFSLLW